MGFAPLDEEERALTELDPLTLDDGYSLPPDDEEPLIRSTVPVVGAALDPPRIEGHLGGLRMFVTEHDVKAHPESQLPVLHGLPPRTRLRGRWRIPLDGHGFFVLGPRVAVVSSLSETPRSSWLSAMCSALRSCLSLYLDLTLGGIVLAQIGSVL